MRLRSKLQLKCSTIGRWPSCSRCCLFCERGRPSMRASAESLGRPSALESILCGTHALQRE
eukprot:2959931-Pleurochrysis_carterae.AAC.1